MAYQHSVQISTAEHRVATTYDVALATCREAATDLCTVLESRISTGRSADASLKFRARPEGIRKLVVGLSRQAEITDQSTTAEDLANPIEDATRKLAMLADYRTKLEALADRASKDVDALIKVSRELAQVQSELEAIAGTQAHLMQRVETEILNVSISSSRNQSFWKPIALAMSDFGKNFALGVSTAISGIAYLTPGALVLVFFAWLGRKLWRRRKQPEASA